jgi:hypothetical protein
MTDFDTFCGICGFPIRTFQIGTVIDDCFLMDFTTRSYVDFSAHICSECWEKIKTNTSGGMPRAMQRQKELNKSQGLFK